MKIYYFLLILIILLKLKAGVKLFFENTIDINKYKIIHSYNNCYYLKK